MCGQTSGRRVLKSSQKLSISDKSLSYSDKYITKYLKINKYIHVLNSVYFSRHMSLSIGVAFGQAGHADHLEFLFERYGAGRFGPCRIRRDPAGSCRWPSLRS